MIQPITRSVWSFWTKPFETHKKSNWFSEKHHLFAWVLSLETARKYYPETALVTDDAGAKILVDGIGLEFDSVSLELNALQASDPEWWVLGKLWAYRIQKKPFIHLDNDVFLWKALPERVTSAPVLAQNPEYFVFGDNSAPFWWYRPETFDAIVKSAGGWLPKEWLWYVSRQGNCAFCCGILGANQVDFINHYADTALQIAENPDNQTALSLIKEKPRDSVLIEQYFLAACIEYHKNFSDSAFQNVDIQCLFQSPEEAFTPTKAQEAGYTHLIGDAKRDQDIAQRLEKRVARDYPHHYARCLQYLNKVEIYMGSNNRNQDFNILHQSQQLPDTLALQYQKAFATHLPFQVLPREELQQNENAILQLTSDTINRHIVDRIGEIPADGVSFCTITVQKVVLGGISSVKNPQQEEIFLRTTGGILMDEVGENRIRSVRLNAGQAKFRLGSERNPKIVTIYAFGYNPMLKAEIQIEFV